MTGDGIEMTTGTGLKELSLPAKASPVIQNIYSNDATINSFAIGKIGTHLYSGDVNGHINTWDLRMHVRLESNYAFTKFAILYNTHNTSVQSPVSCPNFTYFSVLQTEECLTILEDFSFNLTIFAISVRLFPMYLQAMISSVAATSPTGSSGPISHLCLSPVKDEDEERYLAVNSYNQGLLLYDRGSMLTKVMSFGKVDVPLSKLQ
tara:strand:+ start:458 stop:1075 length:618 start_codon:yes stop_codon:yes gene_type:complete